MKKLSVLVYIGLTLFGVLLAWWYYQHQPANNLAENRLADGNQYLKIYHYFKGEASTSEARHSYHQRIGVPFLAALMPTKQPYWNFFIVNSFFACLALPMLYGLLKHFQIRSAISLSVILFFSLHWIGPFRHNAMDPVNVDMPVYVFEILLILLLLNRKYWLLLLIMPFAIAAKEVFLGYILALVAVAILGKVLNIGNTIPLRWALSLLVVGLMTSLTISWKFPSPTPSITPVHVFAFHVRETLMHPIYILQWFLSLFAAMGAFLWLSFRKYKKIPWPIEGGLILPTLSAAALVFSLFGGMDYTRIIFIGFPYIMVLLLVVTKPAISEFYMAFGLSLLLTRFWMVLPTIGSDLSPYYAWMPEYAPLSWLAIWGLVAVSSLTIVLLWMWISDRSLQSSQSGNDV